MTASVDTFQSDIRDKSIDGLRGVAVLLVVMGHAISFRFGAYVPAVPLADAIAGGWSPTALYLVRRAAGPLSEAGVFVFFAISGYLIAGLLAAEERRAGSVSLAAFYTRRIFRIAPPLLLYLLASVAARKWGLIAFEDGELVTALLFLCNTGLECSWWFGHLWSLSIEEQFYIVWPFVFILAPRNSRVKILTLCLVALTLISTIGLLRTDPPRLNAPGFSAIALGSICALSPVVREQLCKRIDNRTFWLAFAFLATAPMVWPYATALPGLVPVTSCILLLGAGRLPVRSFLLSSPVQVVGLSSYSLYLWQQIFLGAPEMYLLGPPSLLLLAPVVWFSVRFIEVPFMRLGRRLSDKLHKRRVEPALGGAGPGEARAPGGQK